MRRTKIEKVEFDEQKIDQFNSLFQQFLETYAASEKGQMRIRLYRTARAQGRGNFWQLVAEVERGETITDEVIRKLLPHSNTPARREEGVWIHPTRSGDRDIREWHEEAGWQEPGEWPQVALAIFELVRRCYENPDELEEACRAFDALPYSKGFQTGMLTPILSTLRPDEFLLINKACRAVINYLADTSHSGKLREYPKTNKTGWQVIEELSPMMGRYEGPEVSDSDLFDLFCHWVVAVKDFSLRPVRYWKIAAGEEPWIWNAWRDDGFVAIGWDRLGDLTGMSKPAFEDRLEALDERYPEADWNEHGAGQVWRFAKEVQEGDRILVNQGAQEVLGLGTVAGPYRFEPGVPYAHRRPVDWKDLQHRQVNQEDWMRTLMEVDEDTFKAVGSLETPNAVVELAAPFSTIFEDRAECEWAFDLLRETLSRLGINDASDERFSISLPKEDNVLRLSVGGLWCVLQFSSPDWSQYRVAVALTQDQAARTRVYQHWSLPDDIEAAPAMKVYRFPIDAICPLEGELRKAYENTLSHIAERVEDLEASQYRKDHVTELARAVFDREKRAELLTRGVKDETTLAQRKRSSSAASKLKRSDAKTETDTRSNPSTAEEGVTEDPTFGARLFGLGRSLSNSTEGPSFTEGSELEESLYTLGEASHLWICGESETYDLAVFVKKAFDLVGLDSTAFVAHETSSKSALRRMDAGDDVLLALVNTETAVHMPTVIQRARSKGIQIVAVSNQNVSDLASEAESSLTFPLETDEGVPRFALLLHMLALVWETLSRQTAEHAECFLAGPGRNWK